MGEHLILCDYCDALAEHLVTRGPRWDRSLICGSQDCRVAMGMDFPFIRSAILPNRPRYEELDVEELAARLRKQIRVGRAALAAGAK